MIKAFILCAGEGTRWGKEELPKQLITINNESLLARTIRLLRKNHINEIVIVAANEQLRQNDCKFFSPAQRAAITETLLSTQALWQKKILVLLGDVFFSEYAMKTIVANEKPLVFFGRSGESWYSECGYGEIYALSCHHSCFSSLQNGLKSVIASRQRSKLWHLYRYLSGFSLNEHSTDSRFFTEINDYTTDFDYYEDYLRHLPKYEYFARNQYFNTWVFCDNPNVNIISVEFA